MLEIQNQPIIHAAFDVALFNINNINVQKHANSKYKPLVSTTLKLRWQNETLICNFTNNKIFAIGEGDNIDILKRKDDMSIVLHKDFRNFDEAVNYFTRTIHHKIFNSKNNGRTK